MVGSTTRLAKYKAASSAVGVLTILLGVALAVLGFATSESEAQLWLLTAGCVAILGGLVVMIATGLLLKIESHSYRAYNQLIDMHEVVRRQTELLTKVSENSALSDAARALTNRDQDSEALRAVIRADIRTEQWDAALSLVDGMEQRFGYVEEARSLRNEINEARVEAMRCRMNEATEMIDRMLSAFQWEAALHEIDRLHRALPDEPRIAKLRALYDQRRAARKASLLKEWNSAVERNDVDGAIAILRDLDSYLTREEARSLEQSARGVFKAKLLQLGMQFQFAVSEQRWRDALEVGVQITEEFPNSRMSQEVVEAMEGLRIRAGLPSDVEVTTAQPNPPPTS